jgi:oxygen-independent coproporphyrinogen-3 oxidase
LAGIRARCSVLPNAEITLEANHGTVDEARFTGFHAAGITRLSLGIQSFNTTALQALGRIHGQKEALTAIESALKAGFTNFNVDLMFALPGQTEQQALHDLQIALDFAPPHLSWYQLTIEPNTLFHRRPPPLLPEDDDLWAIQTAGQQYLAERGYQHYEVSAYAQPKRQCRHNVNYWQFGDYVGIGAGAHSKISDAMHGTITRSSKQRHPQRYLANAATPAVLAETRQLTLADIRLEFMLNALRLHEGFTVSQFTAHTGLPLECVQASLQQAQVQGWLIQDADRFFPTTQGRLFLNEMLELFMS